MSVLIKRLLPRFTIVGLLFFAIGFGIYLSDLGQEGTAQSDPNAGPTLLQSTDIGHVGSPGAYAVIDGEHLISSYGSDIWDTRDGFHFAYQSWQGDGEFIVRIHEMSDTHARARAGIMIRASLEPNAANAFIAATPKHGTHFLRRTATDNDTVDDAHTNLGMTDLEDRSVFQRRFTDLHPHDKSTINQVGLPRWLRLVRTGNAFHAYDSADGQSWDWLGTETVTMDKTVYVGLAVSARNPKQECLARFSDLSFQGQSVETLAARLFAEPVLGQGDGLKGRYFSDRTFSNEVLSRVDEELFFVWNLESPAEGMPNDHFSVRWEGLIEAQYTEPYLIHLISDEQAMLWLDGRLLIDDWFEHRATQTSALVNLEAGKKYHLRVDYTEATAHAMVSLGWSSPSTERQGVPQSQLYSQLPDTDNDQVPDAWERAFNIEPGESLPLGLRQNIEAAESAKPVEAVLRERYARGEHAGAQSGRSKPVAEAADWTSLDLSPAGPSGKAQGLSSGRQRLEATGARYGEVNGQFPHVLRDKFHFSYQSKRGDQELIARVIDIESASPSTLGGLMARVSKDATSAFVAVVVSPTRESWLLSRREAGYSARMQRLGAGAEWLKLQRRGEGVSLFESSDGESWRWLAHEAFPESGEACLGLVAQGEGMAETQFVEFSDVSLRALRGAPRELPPVRGSGDGLRASYYDGINALNRVDSQVDFFWPEGEGPTEEFNENQFTVTWEGEVQAAYSESYTFEIRCDDGARLWLDGLLLVDDWRDSGDYPRNVRVELQAGRRYPIRLEYYEATGDAMARLSWSSPSTVKEPIPQSQLYTETGAESFSFVGRGNGPRLAWSDRETQRNSEELFGPPAPDTEGTLLQQINSLDVSTFQNPLGDWAMDETGVVCQSRRGSLEYDFELEESGMYLLEIVGEAVFSHPDPNYLLWIDVDGQHLSRRLLSGSETKRAEQLTPWLQPGRHRLRIFWDNTLPSRSLRLREINLKIIRGPDEDGNRISDWMEAELARSNSVDSPTESDVSPAMVEGHAVYSGLMTARVGTEIIPVSPGAGERWNLSLPLVPDQATQVDLNFENGGIQRSHEVSWTPTNLATTGSLTVRQGDSLLLTVVRQRKSKDSASVAVEGNLYQLADGETVAHQFNHPGALAIQVLLGPGQPRIVLVSVLAPLAIEDIAALVGHWREWSPPDLPDGIVIESDPSVELGRLASTDGIDRFRLRTNEPITRYLNLRLGEGGPILQQLAVEGFRFDYGNRTGPARVAQTFADKSRIVAVDAVMTPLREKVSLEGNILAGGILYASGQISEGYGASAFNELGIMTQSFFQSESSKTSVCHEVDLFQGTQQINEF